MPQSTPALRTRGRRRARSRCVAEGERLFVVHEGARVPLERLADADRFVARHPALDRFAFVFGRKDPRRRRARSSSSRWGGDWYRNAHYAGPEKFDYPRPGTPTSVTTTTRIPGSGASAIVVLKGRLMLDGTIPLEADGDLFRLRDTPFNAEWIRFGEVVNGRCMRIRLSGSDLWRVAAP